MHENQQSHKAHADHGDQQDHRDHYRLLLLMTILSFLSMYILMYAMVDVIGNVYSNLGQFYMAGLMTAPMVVIELFLMKAMYRNKRLNALIATVAVVAALLFFWLIRQQAAMLDRQFLRAMIPHHGAAILMCERAPLEDPQVQDLCDRIISNQQAEIDEMRARLSELE